MFGLSVDLADDYAVVGDRAASSSGNAAGAAYVFDADDGSLLQTLANPTPSYNDFFGSSLAVDGDHALVGAYLDDTGAANAGAAYLFDVTDGSLLRTLQAPVAAEGDFFGWSLALSGDQALVGTRRDGNAGEAAGAVYLFDTADGSVDATFSSPTASAGSRFGWAVTMFGDLVVVGDPDYEVGGVAAGAAHVYDAATGALLQTIANPTPEAGDKFGWSVALEGDLLLVGDYSDDTAGEDAGAAYLFDVDGGSLTQTFVNPEPNLPSDPSNFFGYNVDLSDDMALISDSGASEKAFNGGAAYLFDTTTGQYIATLTNEPPVGGERFGGAVSLNGDQALLGTGGVPGTDRGAYLIDLDPGLVPTTPPVTARAVDSGAYYMNHDGTVENYPENGNFYSDEDSIGFIVISLADIGGVIEDGSIDFGWDIGTFWGGVDEAYDQTVTFRAFDGDMARLLGGGDRPDVYDDLANGAAIAEADIPYVPDLRDRFEDMDPVPYPPAIDPFEAELNSAGIDFLNSALARGEETVAFSITMETTGPGGGVFAQTEDASHVSLSLSISDTVLMAVADAAATDEDSSVTIAALANDAGAGVPGADPLSIVSAAGQSIATGGSVVLDSGAVVTLTADGELIYDPGEAYQSLREGKTATEVFSYEISNGLSVETSEIEVTVTGVNDAPTQEMPIPDQVATVGSSFEYWFDTATFADIDDGDWPSLWAKPVGGGFLPAWLDFDPDAGGLFSGTPGAGDTGPVEIEIIATDGSGESVSDVFVISVLADGDVNVPPTEPPTVPPSEPPSVPSASATLKEGKSASGHILDDDMLLSVSSVDGGPVGGVKGEFGTLNIDDDGAWTYVADSAAKLLKGETAVEQFELTVADDHGRETSTMLELSVTGRIDKIKGGAEDDTLKGGGGDDKLVGKRGDDKLVGKGGPDKLIGGGGDDKLVGGAGDDMLRGGGGDDVLKGKHGADTLVFSTGDGKDKVVGWEDGLDMIRIHKGASGFDDLEISQKGHRTIIDYGDDADMIVLKKIDADHLDASDFIFG